MTCGNMEHISRTMSFGSEGVFSPDDLPTFPRALDGNPPKEPMGHEQSRAYRPGDRGGDRLPLLVDNRRVTFASSGATTGHEDCKSSEGAIVDDPGRAAEQVHGTGAPHTGEGDQRPADADDPRSDGATGPGDRDLRTLQEPQDVAKCLRDISSGAFGRPRATRTPPTS